jgi:hypothetical protein
MRGKVLRDTSNGNGLISSEGKQFEFSLEKNWKSDETPKVGMVVEFDLGVSGEIFTAHAINENQLAKEQAEIALAATKKKGVELFNQASARVGTPVLIAWGLVAISWFFLNAISISLTSVSSVGVSFWDLLGVLNNSTNIAYLGSRGTGDKGIFVLLVIVALAGPAIAQVWKNNLAHLGSCIPFALMLVVTVMIYMSIRDTATSAVGLFGGVSSDAMSNLISAVMKAIHIGVGGAVAAIASGYLAFSGARKYLVAKAQA